MERTTPNNISNLHVEDNNQIRLAHIICWDNIEYDRETNDKEIEEMRKKNLLKSSNTHSIIFDYR